MSTIKYALVCADDDPIVLQMLGFQLEKIIDPQVTICEFFTSPEEVLPGIDQLKGQGIETLFLIVDYQMPKMSGADLIRQVKGKYPQIKCLMLSGQANAIHVDALADENYLESFLPKPWEEGDLFQLLGPVLSLKYERNFLQP
jgi:CheY-like chemotaxis protein